MKRIHNKTDEKVSLQCLSCERLTSNRCHHCQTAPYCNKRCWQMQRELHKKICYPVLGDRLRAMVSYSKANGVSLNDLSSFETIRYRTVSAFSRHAGYHCAVCEKSLGIHVDYLTRHYIYFGKQLMYYRLCNLCTQENRRLCQVSLMEPTICQETHIDKYILLIFLDKSIVWDEFPDDIVLYILSFFIMIDKGSNCIH